MNAVPNIERRDSGPSYMDRASEHYGDTEAASRERELARQFAKAVAKGDANALCPWAPYITDWETIKRTPVDQRTATALPKRQQTLAELMDESIDYGRGPSLAEAMQLILNAASGSESTQQQARDLLARMGDAFARMNA